MTNTSRKIRQATIALPVHAPVTQRASQKATGGPTVGDGFSFTLKEPPQGWEVPVVDGVRLPVVVAALARAMLDIHFDNETVTDSELARRGFTANQMMLGLAAACDLAVKHLPAETRRRLIRLADEQQQQEARSEATGTQQEAVAKRREHGEAIGEQDSKQEAWSAERATGSKQEAWSGEATTGTHQGSR